MNQFEYEALDAEGLPHECQVLYMRVLRRYMDYKTGIVGVTRRLSYQGLREVLEVRRPQRSKVSSQTYTQRQVRWFLERLEAVGLISKCDAPLVFLCRLASTDLVRPDVQRQYNGTTAAGTTAHNNDSLCINNQQVSESASVNSVISKNSQSILQRHTSVSPNNSLSILNARKKFQMHSDWVPVDEQRVAVALSSFGVDPRELSDWQKSSVVDQFVNYWVNERPEVRCTQSVWEDKFCESALRVLRGRVN